MIIRFFFPYGQLVLLVRQFDDLSCLFFVSGDDENVINILLSSVHSGVEMETENKVCKKIKRGFALKMWCFFFPNWHIDNDIERDT